MTLRDGQRAEILFLLTLIGKCTLEIPGDLADAYSTLLAETGTRASVVCGPWLFEAIGTPPWTPARGGLPSSWACSSVFRMISLLVFLKDEAWFRMPEVKLEINRVSYTARVTQSWRPGCL